MRQSLAGAALAFSLFASAGTALAQTPETAPAPATDASASQPVTTGETLGESGAKPGTPGGISDTPAGAEQRTPTENATCTQVDLLCRLKPELFGYVKLGYFFVTSPADDALIGGANGFRLVNARVGLALHPAERLQAVISVDAS